MIFIAIFLTVALLMGVIGPLVLFGGYGFLKARRDEWPVVLMIWLVGIGSVLAIALASRNWNVIGAESGFSQLTGAGIWSTRLINVAAGSLAFIEVVRRLAMGTNKEYEYRGRAMAVGLALFAGSWILSSFVGTKPDFKHGAIYPLLTLTAVYLQPRLSLRLIMSHVKALILVILILSAVAAAVVPDAVIQNRYVGFIPGLHFRFHGLTTHANSLGPLALVYLLVEYLYPSPWVVRWAGSLLALAALVVAQSKTAWIAALLAGSVVYVYRVGEEARGRTASGGHGTALVGGIAGLIIVPTSLIVVMLVADPIGKIARYVEPRIGELTSFTGRNRIWEITLDTWRDNPFFGYGPNLWDTEFRMNLGLTNIGHAHNQFLQSLGDSGLFGLVFLVIFLSILAFYAVRHGRATRGVSVALILVLLVRCLTEAPMRPTTFLEPGFLTYFLVFLLLTQHEKASGQRAEQTQATG